ncbi:MAG: winged helix-turn-helix transcriptional regulator [Candidatus Lokiarchaeota archaeon]|nr:winged helix-turn-helix transcriptional regulator [Candidatus Lokiarchaeota archaeon]
MPYQGIGDKLEELSPDGKGLTGNAVRTRVMRLIENGVIEDFVFKLNPEVFGIRTCYVKFQCPQKLEAAKLIDKKIGKDARYPEIITGINGETIVHVYGTSKEDLHKSVEDLRAKLGKIELELIIQRYKPPIKEARINPPLMKVIQCLNEDARMSVSDIANKCNMTSKSVRYYLKQIEVKKIGRFSINLQPYNITQRIFVSLFVSKPDIDYVHFSTLFNNIRKDFKNSIVKDYLLVEPPGIFINLTTESLEEIDHIEQNITSSLKEDYIFWKMFPSLTIYRDNLIHEIINRKLNNLDTIIE